MQLKHEAITEEAQEQAALHALGAMSQHEAHAFSVHVREGCSVCEQEAEGFSRVVAELAAEPSPVAPPAYLRDVLAARIEREHAPPIISRSVIPFPEHAPHRQVEQRATKSSMGSLLPWAVAAALLIAFAYSTAMW